MKSFGLRVSPRESPISNQGIRRSSNDQTSLQQPRMLGSRAPRAAELTTADATGTPLKIWTKLTVLEVQRKDQKLDREAKTFKRLETTRHADSSRFESRDQSVRQRLVTKTWEPNKYLPSRRPLLSTRPEGTPYRSQQNALKLKMERDDSERMGYFHST